MFRSSFCFFSRDKHSFEFSVTQIFMKLFRNNSSQKVKECQKAFRFLPITNVVIVIVIVISTLLSASSCKHLKCAEPERASGHTQYYLQPHALSHRERFEPYYYAVFHSGHPLYTSCSSIYLPRRDGRLSRPVCPGDRTRALYCI